MTTVKCVPYRADSSEGLPEITLDSRAHNRSARAAAAFAGMTAGESVASALRDSRDDAP
jgi:hypothetical protein